MKPVITSLALPVIIIIIIISARICDARILNVPEDYQTIQAGIDASQSLDTILVQPGVYPDPIRIRAKSLILISMILRTNDPAFIDSTILEGQYNHKVIRLDGDTNDSTLIRGFTIRGGHRREYGSGLDCHDGQRLKLEDVTLSHNLEGGRGGGLYGSPDTDVELRRVRFIENTAITGGGAFLYSRRAIIEDCQFLKNYANTGASGMSLTYPCGASLRRILIADNSAEGSCALGVSVPEVLLDRLTIANNHAGYVERLNRAGQAVFFGGDSSNVQTLQNSILYGNESIQIRTSIENVRLLYCDIQGLTDSLQAEFEWCDFELVGCIDSDPLFLDPDNGDYRLSANSPCIDAGDPEAPLDPDGTRADIGAFYFHQRDIELDADEIDFPSVGWGVLDSILFPIHNVGGTPLTITSILNSENMACIGAHAFPLGEDSIVIEPFSDFPMFIYYRPDSAASQDVAIFITSNDPDEPEITVHVVGHVLSVPSDTPQSAIFNLHSAYPNPFNSSTTIQFSTSRDAYPTRIGIYGLDGRMMDEMDMGILEAGEHSVVWNAESLPAGVYIVRLESGEDSRMLKVVLVR